MSNWVCLGSAIYKRAVMDNISNYITSYPSHSSSLYLILNLVNRFSDPLAPNIRTISSAFTHFLHLISSSRCLQLPTNVRFCHLIFPSAPERPSDSHPLCNGASHSQRLTTNTNIALFRMILPFTTSHNRHQNCSPLRFFRIVIIK